MIALWTESVGILLSILTPLVAVPLTAITFYLRSLREQQQSIRDGLVVRVESVERSVADVRRGIADFERDYTTKEEWLRECMLARRTLEQLSKATVRLETMLHAAAPALRSTFHPGADRYGQPPGSREGAAPHRRRDEDDE